MCKARFQHCRGRKTNPLADKAAAAVRKSKRVQQALLLLAVLGTSMTIGDGVMTAAASGVMLVNFATSFHLLQMHVILLCALHVEL